MSGVPTNPGQAPDGESGVQYRDLGGNTDYDPKAVQDEITGLLMAVSKGHPLSPGMTELVMSLMMQYGMQNVGLDANITGNLNGYFTKIQDLNTQLAAAEAEAAAELKKNPPGPINDINTAPFLADLKQLKDALASDPFFTTGPGSQIAPQIESQIDALVNTVNTGGGLVQLWKNSIGTPGNPTGTPPVLPTSDPSGINSVNAAITSIQSMYTGVSKSVQATLQADAAQETVEQDTLNKYMEKWSSCLQVMLQNLQTH